MVDVTLFPAASGCRSIRCPSDARSRPWHKQKPVDGFVSAERWDRGTDKGSREGKLQRWETGQKRRKLTSFTCSPDFGRTCKTFIVEYQKVKVKNTSLGS